MSLQLIADYVSDSDPEDIIMDQEPSGLPIKAIVLKNNIINACMHGPKTNVPKEGESLRSMLAINATKEPDMAHREVDGAKASSSSDSSDLEIESVKDVLSDDGNEDDVTPKASNPVAPQALEDIELADLPPIEDLHITVPPTQVMLIGKIISIVQQVVVVESLPDKPTMNLESVLFLEKGARTLGSVYDVFGNVNAPNYVIRFNSREHVDSRDVKVNMEVYYAPQTEFTKFVLLAELLKFKGTDASWVGEGEPPQGIEAEFSDDEAERQHLRRKKNPNRANRTFKRITHIELPLNINTPTQIPQREYYTRTNYPPQPYVPGPGWEKPRPRFEDPSHPLRNPPPLMGIPHFHPFRPPVFPRPNLQFDNNDNYNNYYYNGRGNH